MVERHCTRIVGLLRMDACSLGLWATRGLIAITTVGRYSSDRVHYHSEENGPSEIRVGSGGRGGL